LNPCSLDTINVVLCIQLKFYSKMSLIFDKVWLFSEKLEMW
jgi:hypothetical protein